MSAGTGITHAEYNLEGEKTTLFQIWIMPDRRGEQPSWGQREFPKADRSGKWGTLAADAATGAAANDDAVLPIRADAKVLAARLGAGETLDYEADPARHLYLVSSYRLQIGDARAARAIAKQAITINEASGAIGRTALASQYELLGRANEALGDLDAALAAFRRGLQPDLFGAKLGYDGGDLYLGAARTLRKLDRVGESELALREASDIWRSMPERHPIRAELAIENGFAALERGDPFTARAAAELARRLLPARPEWDASREELAILQQHLVIAGAPMS
jgi:tetratricopeptide (TPR) repeat protein